MKLHAWMLAGICTFGITAQNVNEEYEVDIKKKIKECRALVTEAVTFFQNNTIPQSCRAFATDSVWRKGEIGVFVFDDGGVCYVFGSDQSVIWKDFHTDQTPPYEAFVPAMLETGKTGGLINFRWRNVDMQAYVKRLEKDGQTFILGAGFYPASDHYMIQQLVDRAAKVGADEGSKRLFGDINSPLGAYRKGDLYLFVDDMNGQVMAHGKSLELLGQDLMEEKSADGKFITKDMIDIAKGPNGRGWYSFKVRPSGIEKRVYVARFTDPDTKKDFIIEGGYYPSVDDHVVQTLVKKATSYLRSNGRDRSFPEFSKRNSTFAYGNTSIFVYGLDGEVLADSQNQAYVGLNLMNARDQEGRYTTKTILEQAKKYPGGSWVGFALNNAYCMMYVEKVSVPDGEFVIGASYFPVSKYINIKFMVEKAVLLLKNKPQEEVFARFVNGDSEFCRGDISILVLDPHGDILVDGDIRSHIWQSAKDWKDDKGRLVLDKIVGIATSGGGWLEFEKNSARFRAYVKEVEKTRTINQGEKSKTIVDKFIVSSGYYL